MLRTVLDARKGGIVTAVTVPTGLTEVNDLLDLPNLFLQARPKMAQESVVQAARTA